MEHGVRADAHIVTSVGALSGLPKCIWQPVRAAPSPAAANNLSIYWNGASKEIHTQTAFEERQKPAGEDDKRILARIREGQVQDQEETR